MALSVWAVFCNSPPRLRLQPLASLENAKQVPVYGTEGPFPVYQVTLHNPATRSAILTELKVNVSKFQPRRHVSTRELVPTSRWDVKVPAQAGVTFHKPRHPILIAADDAVTLEIRVSCNADHSGACHPALLGGFRLQFSFYAGAGAETTTEEITIGSIED